MLRTIRVPILATTLAGFFLLSSLGRATGSAESDHISKILSDTKAEAFQLKEDAGELERFSHADLSWESHASALNRIKDNLNKMSRLLAELQNSRAGAARWQQVAIDRITPVAKELASNTSAAMEHLNQSPNHLNTPDYQEYLEAISDSATNLAAMITNFVDYGKTRERLDRLAAKLELPARR